MKYIKKGYGKNIILLHGWGAKKEMFNEVIESLSKNFCVWAIDFSGFGESQAPSRPYYVDDYKNELKIFIEKHEIINPILLGHSFGGRVAIKYATKNKINKLILVDAAGIRRVSKKVYIYKIKKKIYKIFRMKKTLNKLYLKYASSDYKEANFVMKETLKNVIKEDLSKELKKIPNEALLLWGSDDTATPLKDGMKMNKLLINSEIIVFKKTGHFPFLEKRREFLIILNKYLESEHTND